MAELKGNGKPGKHTTGAVGDIYTDIETGNRYKCTFAYRTGNTGNFDCDWKHVGTKPLEKIEKNTLYGVQQKKEPVNDTKKPVENKTPARTDYSSFSKNNKPVRD